jgi:Rap guanine nucleotide exchange factor 2
MLSSSTSQHTHHHHNHSHSHHHSTTSPPSSSEIDLSGLIESVVDEDDSVSSFNENCSDIDVDDSDDENQLEDDSRSQGSVRDCVRECLEKDPSERNDNDVSVLLDFTRHLAAFHDLTLNVRRALCQRMVFAVVEKANTIVMSDGEELDSWSVLVNGAVEILAASGEVSEFVHY